MPDPEQSDSEDGLEAVILEQNGPPEGRTKLVDAVLRTCQSTAMILIILLMLLTVAHVIGRYIFKFPMLGVVEVSGLMVITLVFLAGPYNFLIDRHIKVDVILRRLPPRGRIAVEMFMQLLCLVIVGLAVYATMRQGISMAQAKAKSVTSLLRILNYPFYFVVAFGWLLSVVALVVRLVNYVYEWKAVK